MMKGRKFAVGLFLAALVLLGATSIFYTLYRLRDNPEFLSDKAPKVDDRQNAEGNKIALVETRNGKRKWVMHLDKIKYNRENSKAKMVGVTGTVFDDQQKVLFTFKSPKGIYDKLEGHVLLTSGAEMQAPKAKVKINSDTMAWSADSGQMIAEGGVVMVKNGFGYSKAKRAILEMDLTKIHFQGGAVAVMGKGAKNPTSTR